MMASSPMNIFFLLRRTFGRHLLSAIGVSAFAAGALADPVASTDLSGVWTFTPLNGAATTIQVPGGGWYKQGFTTISEADYQRQITVPNVSSTQVTRLEFGAVNYQADVYINNVLVGSRITSFTPSTFDLSSAVAPGGTYTLRVHVKGRGAFMVSGKSVVPNAAGWSPNTPQGIFRSARLAIYNPISIQSVFVRPVVSSNQLYYDVWVSNSQPQAQSVTLSGSLNSWNGTAWSYPAIPDTAVTAAASSVTKVTIGPIAWNLGSTSYWWPNVPYVAGYRAQLHNLVLTAGQSGATVDQTTVRFGFRETRQASDGTNTCYFLNGIRVNFRGDSLQGADYDSINSGGGYGDAYDTLPGFLEGANGWRQAVDNYQRLNFNFVRLHQEPVTPFMLDVCDEMGLMTMEETAIRGSNGDQNFITGHDNMVNHLTALFTRDRNHASIVRQSLSNEPSFSGTDSTQFETDLYNAAMAVDGTRPLSIDIIGGETYPTMNYANFSTFGHYGGGLGGYTEQVWKRADRPYGQGEFVWFHDNTAQGFTWFATGTQGMRAQGASDVRPYTLLSAWASFVPGVRTTDMLLEQGGHPLYGIDNLSSPWSNPIIQRVQTGFHPVLVADAAYWGANRMSNANGDWPSQLPYLFVNQTVTRTLNVYNDTFAGTAVDVHCEFRQDSPTGPVLSSGVFNLAVPLGTVQTLPVQFTTPNVADGTRLFLVLWTVKNGVEQFRETAAQFVAIDAVRVTGTAFGASPAYSAGHEFGKASDGDRSTYYDYVSADGGITGIDLGAGVARRISMIQFSPRSGYETRMVGGVFEGSNDGTNYSPLFTVTAAPGAEEQVTVTDPTPYRYLRYRAPAGAYGNIAEMGFFTATRDYVQVTGSAFGSSPAYAVGREFDKASDGDPATYFDYLNANGGITGLDLGAGNARQVTLLRYLPRPGYESRMVGGVFSGSNDGANYTTLYTIPSAPTSWVDVPLANAASYRYLRYQGPAGSYGDIAEMQFFYTGSNPPALGGTRFGASPAYAAGREFDKASDGDRATFYDYSQASGGYAGFDFGTAKSVGAVQFFPRPEFESRLVGGIFQGSNDQANWTPLFTITGTALAGHVIEIKSPTAYRYVRYLGPAGSYSNIAEMTLF